MVCRTVSGMKLYAWLQRKKEELESSRAEPMYAMGKINMINDLLDELGRVKPFGGRG